MNIHQSYLLASGVVFIAADDIPEGDRQHLVLADTDVVITHNHTRKRSKVVSEATAALLKNFSTPQTMAEAIFSHALLTQQDPQILAETAFPVLLEMKEEGYLVPESETAPAPKKNQRQPGETFRHYKIKEVCQVMENSAVYKAEDANANAFALKIFTPVQLGMPPADYQNEVAVLEKMDGVVNPKLVENGIHDGVFYFVTEWCEGLRSDEAFKRYRNFLSKKNVLALMDLCLAVLNAFAHLHRQGILHGDIHLNNVLIDGNDVKIIDYGSAVSDGSQQRTLRGGVDFYYEPELANALLLDEASTPLTAKGEQYAVAVLLYRLLTEHHYLQFSYEPEKAYRQICEEPPLSFSAFDIYLPKEVDAVFQKALAKNPLNRFDSLAAFANALEECRNAVAESQYFFVPGQNDTDKKFIRFLAELYGGNGPLLQQGLQLPPTCSVNNGAAGIAYFFYRAACVFENPAWLNVADVWASHAAAYDDEFEKAFYSPADDITESTVGQRALYHSPTGVHVVQALISACRGDFASLQKAIQNYLLTAEGPCKNPDLTLGKAGLLVGSALLLKELNHVPMIDAVPLVLFTTTQMTELWQQLDQCPSIKLEKEINYFGIAHGWAGLLYATLLWCRTSGVSLPERLPERMEELLAEATLHNNILRWPVSGSNSGVWLGWCHGNAGYVFLWILAWQYFREERFLGIAEQSGAALFDSKPQTPNLCCGLAGEAYALLKLYQITGKQSYYQQAHHIKERILQDLSSPDLRNHSLYRGEVGIGVLLCELTRPSLARMPLFE